MTACDLEAQVHNSHLISGDTLSAWQHDKNSQLNVAIERHKRTGS